MTIILHMPCKLQKNIFKSHMYLQATKRASKSCFKNVASLEKPYKFFPILSVDCTTSEMQGETKRNVEQSQTLLL